MRKAGNTKSGFVLGRARFAKIAAVEGIAPSKELSEDFRSFDSRKLSPAERRSYLIRKYGGKA